MNEGRATCCCCGGEGALEAGHEPPGSQRTVAVGLRAGRWCPEKEEDFEKGWLSSLEQVTRERGERYS